MLAAYTKEIGEVISLAALVIISHFLQRKLIKNESKQNRIFTDTSLKRLNGTVTAIIHSWPGQAWIKMAYQEHGETVFRMMEMNDATEKVSGISRLDYLGKTDLEAGWRHADSEEIRRNDLLVWASGEADVFDEPAKNGDRQSLIKIRITSPDGLAKGIMGLAFVGVRGVQLGVCSVSDCSGFRPAKLTGPPKAQQGGSGEGI